MLFNLVYTDSDEFYNIQTSTVLTFPKKIKSNSKSKYACGVSDKLTIYSFMIAKSFLAIFKISKCLFWLYFKASLKNQTNKVNENVYICDFIAVSNKLKNTQYRNQ